MNQLLNQEVSQLANQTFNLICELIFYLINRVASLTVDPLSVRDAGREKVFQSRAMLAQCHILG
jgi:hypothetical protein